MNKTFNITRSGKIHEVEELPTGAFKITFPDQKVRIINNDMGDLESTDWFFEDKKDSDLAQEIGDLIDQYIDSNN